MRLYVTPHVGEIHLDEFTLKDAETVMGKVPAELSPRTRRHVAQAMARLTDVPFLRRLAYGPLTREGLRTDELARLTWADVDLAHNRLDLDQNIRLAAAEPKAARGGPPSAEIWENEGRAGRDRTRAHESRRAWGNRGAIGRGGRRCWRRRSSG